MFTLNFDFNCTIFVPPPAPSAPMITEAFNTSSTSIRINWTAPLSPNGIIRQYIVTYINSEGSSASDMMMTSETTAELTGLMIFTNYNISVRAVTVELGDPSETVTVTTDEDCELYTGTGVCTV